MRFAWLRENSPDENSIEQSSISRLVYILYNAFYWVPIILPFLGIMDYRTGFYLLTAVLLVRFIANLYRNNALTLAQAEVFVLRSP
jgi:hypothetical protein